MRSVCITLFILTCLTSVVWAANPKVALTTNKGVIVIELNAEKAPISAENFLSYVKEGFYNGTVFHRVIKGFMIQGGGMDATMSQKKTHDPIKNEAKNGLKNEKYTLAMARTGEVDSATSQFFINTNDNDFLNNGVRDFGYAVFGKVVEGQQVVDAIENVATSNKGMHQNVPVEPVMIQKAEILK